ncbi:hypothetical protein Hanom_Chr01g00079291 [Helianthus anomalus]
MVNLFFLNIKFGLLKYHHVTNKTTQSYPSSQCIMTIRKFRTKPNKFGKTPFVRIEPYLTLKCH